MSAFDLIRKYLPIFPDRLEWRLLAPSLPSAFLEVAAPSWGVMPTHHERDLTAELGAVQILGEHAGRRRPESAAPIFNTGPGPVLEIGESDG
jgi:hypothetical protein